MCEARGARFVRLGAMRMFVAVELGESVRQAAEVTVDQLRRRVGRAVDARWVSTEKMHLTVRFIGNVPDERVPAVLDSLASRLTIPPFDVTLGECGVFPSHGAPRVLWIGIGEGVHSLQALHDEFDRRLATLGFQPEERPFSAHLTLARIKDVRTGSSSSIRQIAREVAVRRGRSHVTHATVFQSLTSPRGSIYAPLLQVPLER